MGTVETQRLEALAEVKILAQTESTPTLDDSTEVEPLLDKCQRATEWAAATAYAYGQTVVPTTLNGRAYRCIQAGTSSASEPTWPTDGLWGRCGGARSWLTVTDGTAEWEDAGALTAVFDVMAAARLCVTARLGKVGAASVSASAGASWSADGVSVTRSNNAGNDLRTPLLELLRSLQSAGVA
jgi:hypothetical protein